MKYPMFDKNDNAIWYEHEFPIILKCEKCGKSEKFSVYFSNHINCRNLRSNVFPYR